MDYVSCSADELIKDDFFQKWVLSPNEETTAFWERFLAQHPHRREVIEEARQFLLLINFDAGNVPEERILRLKHKIDQAIDQEVNPLANKETRINEPKKRKSLGIWYKVAASLALMLLAFSFYWANQSYHLLDDLLAITATKEQISPKGKRSAITLSDGTQVWINAGSRLKYPDSFADRSTREVFLEGEAYFDVTENPQKPFIVHTSRLSIKVLGTVFNVKSYDAEKTVETTLVEGKVSVAARDNPQKEAVVLLPQQQAIFHKETEKIILEDQVNTEVYTAWRSGKLIFENQPLSVIIPALERWYDVTITMKNKQALDCHFSAKIENKALEEVLELFKTSESIQYEIQGKQVLISGELCD